MDHTLKIRAEAVYEGHPEIAYFVTGVEAAKPLAVDALAECLSKLRRITDELKQHGYQEEDIAVSDQKITNESGELVSLSRGSGFKVAIRVSARTKDFPRNDPQATMKHFAALADAIARSGADMWGRPDFAAFATSSSFVLFSFEDFDGIETMLLTQALADARVKADRIAKSVGKEIKELLAVEAAYPAIGIKGTPRMVTEGPESLGVGGVLDGIRGPLLDGYAPAVCKLSIAATFAWA